MSASSLGPKIGPVVRLWYRWKTLRLPWRKRFLVGLDLQGNTYWIFRDALNQGRWRRIVRYPSKTHYDEIKVPPVWHQWLRHQREDPPSLAEQAQEVARQQRIRLLAAEADARWEAKPSLMDMPGQEKGQPVPALDTGATQPQQQIASEDRGPVVGEQNQESRTRREQTDDPWKHTSGPSENWQPQGWDPTAAKER